MTMSDRGVHPDLLEEVAATRAAGEEDSPSPSPPEAATRAGRARGSRRATATASAAPPNSPPGETVVGAPEGDGGRASTTSSPEGTSPPEWFQSVRESTDPQAALAAILKNVPLDELQKHPQISGWIGNMAQRVSREQAIQKAAEDAVAQKQDAWRRGDYYRLGELTAAEQEALAIQAQQAQASEPFMQSITEFQKGLPEQVQLEIQSKTYPSAAAYFQAVKDASVRYEVEQQVQAEIKKRQPALDKVALSRTVGSEQTPEREGGPSPGVREITDTEIERMTLQEYEQYFENGRPRNGVRLRLTRGIDVTKR